MPLVTVQLLEGRPVETRRLLIRGIAEVAARTLDVPAEAIRVTLVEVSPENWGVGCRTMAEVRAGADTGVEAS